MTFTIIIFVLSHVISFCLGWYLKHKNNPLPYKIEYKIEETGWIGAKVECDVCRNQWIAVYHESCEQLECNNCEAMVNFELIEIAE